MLNSSTVFMKHMLNESEQLDHYKKCAVIINIPDPHYNTIMSLRKLIDERDLDPDERFGDEPHITLAYGFKDYDVFKVKDIGEKEITPIETKLLNNIIIFNTDEHDVVCVDAKSEDIIIANKIYDTIEHDKSFNEYVPHCTLAYVKKGMGNKYKNIEVPFMKFNTTRLQYTFTDKSYISFELGLKIN